VKPAITEAIGRATPAQMAAHLARCDASFDPPLSARVSLNAYAAKLVARAVCIEAWDGEHLVASVAMYCGNDAFISNVSVDPQWTRRGLGTRLLRIAIETAWQRRMAKVRLEVAASNVAALALYQQCGFAPVTCVDGTVTMWLNRPNR
jgi:ribosomal protein S18 acetylase RimI-like enzyme